MKFPVSSWQVGVPPIASLTNCLSVRHKSAWFAVSVDPSSVAIIELDWTQKAVNRLKHLNITCANDICGCEWSACGQLLVVSCKDSLNVYKVPQFSFDRCCIQTSQFATMTTSKHPSPICIFGSNVICNLLLQVTNSAIEKITSLQLNYCPKVLGEKLCEITSLLCPFD